MSRIRTVKPELFKHEGLFELEEETGLPIRLSFIALFTQCDRKGRFKWRPRQLKTDCLPYDNLDFSRVLHALAARGFVVKYESQTGECYGYIPTFEEHQVINNKERGSVIPPVVDCVIIQCHSNEDSTRAPRVNHACATPLSKDQGEYGKEQGREQGKERKEKEKQEKEKTKNVYSEEFEKFWRTYPANGASKFKAAESFKTALGKENHETIIAGASAYADYVFRTGSAIAHATTWLNQQRWTVAYESLDDRGKQKQSAHDTFGKGWFEAAQEYHGKQDDQLEWEQIR